MKMARVARGLHSPIDQLRAPFISELPLSDELFANLNDYPDTDVLKDSHSESAVGDVIAPASPNALHGLVHPSASKLNEGRSPFDNASTHQSHKVGLAQTRPSLPNAKSRALTLPPELPTDSTPRTRNQRAPTSLPRTKQSKVQSDNGHERKQIAEAHLQPGPFQVVARGVSAADRGDHQDGSASPASQYVAFNHHLVRSSSPDETLRLVEVNGGDFPVNVEPALDVTDNNRVRHLRVSGEQYAPSSIASPHWERAPIHGPLLPSYFPQADRKSFQYEIPGHFSQPSYIGTAATLIPRASTHYQSKPSLCSHAAEGTNMAPMLPKHERSSPSSPSLPRLGERSGHGSSYLTPTHSPRRQTMNVARRNTSNESSLVDALLAAMRDMTETEDNPGMLDTWRKIMKEKKAKLERVCKDMLVSPNSYQQVEDLG